MNSKRAIKALSSRWSDRRIAKRFGVKVATVQRWKRAGVPATRASDVEKVRRRVERSVAVVAITRARLEGRTLVGLTDAERRERNQQRSLAVAEIRRLNARIYRDTAEKLRVAESLRVYSFDERLESLRKLYNISGQVDMDLVRELIDDYAGEYTASEIYTLTVSPPAEG